MFCTWTKQINTFKIKKCSSFLHPRLHTICPILLGILSYFLPRIYLSILAHFMASPPNPLPKLSITILEKCLFLTPQPKASPRPQVSHLSKQVIIDGDSPQFLAKNDEADIKALEALGTTYKGITVNQKLTKNFSNC